MILTTKDKVSSVARRWYDQHKGEIDSFDTSFLVNKKSKKQIHDELRSLDLKTATKEDVDNTIGNESWTRITCDICKKDVCKVAVLDDGDFCCLYICNDCIRVTFDRMNTETCNGCLCEDTE